MMRSLILIFRLCILVNDASYHVFFFFFFFCQWFNSRACIYLRCYIVGRSVRAVNAVGALASGFSGKIHRFFSKV